jgi:5,10-methylenetetrahydromethanopterin reductase
MRRRAGPSGPTGIIFLGAPSVPGQVELARQAEANGFESVWIAETRMTRDGIVPMAAIAGATSRVRVGSGILNVYTRHPVALALSFICLNEIAPGRIVMGLGPGSPLVLAPQGIAFEKPLTRLREYCEVLRPLMRGEEVTYRGETVVLDHARIEDLLEGTDAGTADAGSIPLLLGVTGPKALELAGELADGLMMNVCMSMDYVRDRQRVVEAGARKAARTLADVELSAVVCCSPHSDSAEGKDHARRFVALYLSMFPNLARETGVDLELVDRIRTLFTGDGVEAASRLVGDDVVDRLTAAGTPDECRARIAQYRAENVLPILFPVPGAMELTLATLA